MFLSELNRSYICNWNGYSWKWFFTKNDLLGSWNVTIMLLPLSNLHRPKSRVLSLFFSKISNSQILAHVSSNKNFTFWLWNSLMTKRSWYMISCCLWENGWYTLKQVRTLFPNHRRSWQQWPLKTQALETPELLSNTFLITGLDTLAVWTVSLIPYKKHENTNSDSTPRGDCYWFWLPHVIIPSYTRKYPPHQACLYLLGS